MKVRDVYNPEVISARLDDMLADAAVLMAESNVGSLLIFDDARLVGILTERDLVRAVAEGQDLGTATIGRYVKTDPAVAEPDEEIELVAFRMADAGIRHLPVIEGGQVVGMVSARDLLAP